ncbi:MAG TPA: hypothetical protein VL154_14610 [Acetobacteraceae bacterium]|nr:hypothetical protein [Acetobacteraceae bacterium]
MSGIYLHQATSDATADRAYPAQSQAGAWHDADDEQPAGQYTALPGSGDRAASAIGDNFY